jgi:hypothetical protein
MRKLLLVAGVAAAVLAPCLALAQQTCEQRDNRPHQTAAGRDLNALLGVAPAFGDCAHAYGYYDRDGRWIAGQTADANGRWMPDARNGHTDAHGVWVADLQSGYYDERHQWRAGPARGYYDTRGVWIGVALAADAQGADVAFQGADRRDIDFREALLERSIEAASQSGALSRFDQAADLDRLASIRSREAEMRNRGGQLAPQDESYLQERLDRLSETLRASTPGGS